MRKNIPGTSPYEPIIGFSRAVRVGDTIHLSGTGPVGAEDLDAAGQTRRIFEIAAETLAQADASFEDVVRTRIFLTHAEDWEAVGRVHGEFFGEIRPASTMVVVAALLNPAWRLEMEMEAVLPCSDCCCDDDECCCEDGCEEDESTDQ
ncbi:MAG: RidA family protein [Terracidiphilus sp.]|jgi:enamine deaminase RidA (YjgF/YER057c/UK114 family)